MPGASDTFAQNLWANLKARLDASSVFAEAPAITAIQRGSGDAQTQMEEALGSAARAGIAVFVTEPLLHFRDATGAGSGTFKVHIAEDSVLNRGPGGTRKSVQRVEDAVISALVGWSGALAIGPIVQRGPAEMPDEGQGMIRTLTFSFGILLSTT